MLFGANIPSLADFLFKKGQIWKTPNFLLCEWIYVLSKDIALKMPQKIFLQFFF
jgi:hypothetical protein